jgi:hypothetical protein
MPTVHHVAFATQTKLKESFPVQTQSIKIQGAVFQAPMPFAAGHVVSEIEAKVLNQTFAENLRNNFASQVKKALEDEKVESTEQLSDEALEKLRAAFDEYAAGYQFAGPRQTRAPVDPIEREANRLAADIIRSKLRAKKIDIKTVSNFDDLVEKFLASPAGEEIKAEAKRRVEQLKAVANEALSDDILGSVEVEQPAGETSAAA